MSITVAVRPGAALANTITVHADTLTGGVLEQKLRGILHPIGWAGPPSPAAKAQAAGTLNVQREDKLLSVTPIKAGGTDATHPTLGFSGNWSYDWQVVDRTIADILSAGAEPYLGLDSTPQILGGSVAPYSGTNLNGTNPATGGLAGYASFGADIPSSLPDFAEMCVDLVHRVTVELDVVVPYWSVGNEPDGGPEFWRDPATGLHATAAQYYDYFAAISDAVKAYNPALKIGGPESVDPVAHYSWVSGFLTYCDTNGVALDFLAIHDYTNWGWQIHQMVNKIEATKTSLGWATPLELLVTEWNHQPGYSQAPFNTTDTHINKSDYAAAMATWELMEMQRANVKRAVYFKGAWIEGAVGDFPSGGAFSHEGPWAVGNAFRMWEAMGAASVVAVDIDADPGLHAMAAKVTGTGRLFVLISCAHFKRTGVFPLTINLPGVADGRVTTLSLIDREHSNQYEAGLGNAELQTVPVANVAAEQVRLTLPARCACLLEIAP